MITNKETELFDITHGFEGLEFKLIKDNVTIERSGDVVCIKGKNWRYESIGELSKFTQSGEVNSLRRIKMMIKELLNIH